MSKLFFSTILIIFLLAVSATAQTPLTAAENELAKLDAQIQDAIAAGDAEIIERFVAADMIFFHGFFDGPRETKKDFLAAAKLSPKPYLYRKVSSQTVELRGKFAMVLGRLDIRRRPNSKNSETAEMCYALNFVHLFERRKKRWQLISHRAAQVLEPPRPCV